MKLFSILAISFLAFSSFAQEKLIIHTAEYGVGKFHRADNKAHAYGTGNAWSPYILPDGVTSNANPTILKNTDGSYTVFFSTLDEMMNSVLQIAQTEQRKVSVLNVHGHGLPGAMWFPKDAKAMAGIGCSQWVDAASGSDEDNIQQYYSAVSASEIRQIRQISNSSSFSMPCTTGLKEWQAAVQKLPAFKTVLADDAQMHFLSCVVGLGSVGDTFTKGMAALLLPNGKGHLETSMNFGLGDWSMPAGMGFWDYMTDAQLSHDNAIYPINHKDAELAQPGTIRMATFSGTTWATSLLANHAFMPLNFDSLTTGTYVNSSQLFYHNEAPASVRIIGTNVTLAVEKN